MMMEPQITRHVESMCPVCRQKLNASGSLEGGQKPKPGDISLCIRCGAMLVYEEGLMLRLAREEELGEKEFAPGELEKLKWMARVIALRYGEEQ